ncbi:MAG TPA: exopolysaccharide biosynthesis polyprenyl glycosylphosphotransferase [Gemmatimonadales bacterium]
MRVTPGGTLRDVELARAVGLKRAGRNLRRHSLRDALRVGVLVLCDLSVFIVLRSVVRLIRDQEVFGRFAAEFCAYLVPRGYLAGGEFALALLIGLAIAGAYGRGNRRRDAGRVLTGTALAAVMTFYSVAWEAEVSRSVLQLLVSLAVVSPAIALARLFLDMLVQRVEPSVVPSRVVMVSDTRGDWMPSPDSARTAADSRRAFLVVETVLVGPQAGAGGRATLRELPFVIDEHNADTVLVACPLEEKPFAFVVDVALASGCRLLAASRTAQVAGVEPRGVWEAGRAMVELNAPTLKAWQLMLKRAMDLLVSLAGLVVLSPVIALVALLVKLDSKGPAMFQQTRIGLAGRPFRIFKFRSMVVDAEKRLAELKDSSIYADDRLFKIPRDPRVTRLGSWLRKTSLDELPQLMNVLVGDMSLVGPRPPLPSEVTKYEEHHFCRFDVKPGITGPWQVSGRNEVTDFEAVIRLESAYIREWDLSTDINILLRTIPTVLGMRGAH